MQVAGVCDCVLLGLCEEFELGRQAAWRPRCNRGGVVILVDGTVLLLLFVVACSRAQCVGSSSVVKLHGDRGAIMLVSSRRW